MWWQFLAFVAVITAVIVSLRNLWGWEITRVLGLLWLVIVALGALAFFGERGEEREAASVRESRAACQELLRQDEAARWAADQMSRK